MLFPKEMQIYWSLFQNRISLRQNQQLAETECGKLANLSAECLLAVKWEFYRGVCLHDICAGTAQSACPYVYALANACAQAGIGQDWIRLFPECRGNAKNSPEMGGAKKDIACRHQVQGPDAELKKATG